ncbi:MAG: glutamyl-tRNA reductase [Dehalococcoidia bacterium]
MNILAVGLNHRTAPVEVRERLAFSGSHLRHALFALAEGRTCPDSPLREGTILSTCNRTEIYALAEDADKGREYLVRFLSEQRGLPAAEFEGHLYTHENEDAVDHLFRVAAGIDSMIVGENQILGQVRQAYTIASASKAIGPVLARLFRKGITVGKRARSETSISREAISLSYAAVELAKNLFDDLGSCRALVVGGGKASELTLKNLLESGVGQICIINRTRRKAQLIARQCGGQVMGFGQIAEALCSADIVISSTAAPHPVIRAQAVERAMALRQGRPLLLVDLAVPRDVDPGVNRIDNVFLYDVDDLEKVVAANLERRRGEIPKVRAIIDKERTDFMAWFRALDVLPTIAGLRERAEEIRRAELERALRRLGPLPERQRTVVEALSLGIVNKLLHSPIVNLKEHANGQDGHLYATVIRELFGLADGDSGDGQSEA